MKRLLILGAALCSLNACSDNRGDPVAFERCAALHRGEPRLGQCAQFAPHYRAPTDPVANALMIQSGLSLMGNSMSPQPVYMPLQAPTYTRTVCVPTSWGAHCTTQ